jgi:long-chain acyl-CoA synthetase
VREIGHGLMALGFEARHTASILANTNIEWVLCDLAVLSAGGVSNGIYPTDAPEQVHYLCEDSGTRVLFVEDDEQLDKALAVRDTLPLLQKIVVFDMEGLRDFQDPMVISLKQLQALGREHALQHPDMLRELHAIMNQRVVRKVLLRMKALQSQKLIVSESLITNAQRLMFEHCYDVAA